MVQTSRPWASTSPGDSGPYSNLDWQQLYQAIIGIGASRPNVGVFLGSGTPPNDGLKVQAQSPATTSIDVLIGAAMVQGIAYISTATESFIIAVNSSGNPRIDTVILRADYALQTVRLAVLQGTPAASPSAPALTQSANVMWEIPLADIAVVDSFVTITNANITPRHEWVNAANGVYLDNILNNSGGTLNTGDAVIWDTTADRAVTTTTTLNHIAPAGAWVGTTPNGGYGRVLIKGLGLVRTTGALTRGTGIVIGSIVRQFAGLAIDLVGQIGFMLESSSAGGLALAYIDVQRTNVQAATFAYDVAQNTAGPAYTSGAERTVLVNTELSDPYGIASVASNQITLKPGCYRFYGSVFVQGAAGANRLGWLLLHNVTAGARLLKSNNKIIASSVFADVTLSGEFTLSVQSVIEMRVLVTSTGWTAAAAAINAAGETERYAYMEFERLS